MISTQSSRSLYESYRDRMRKIADVKNASNILQWDQETYLPEKGAAFRGQQLATISEIAHELSTSSELGSLLEELNGRNDLTRQEKRNVELSREDFLKQKKLSSAFVKKMSETISRSFHAWVEARRKNDFGIFAPSLDELLQLKREEANFLGFEDHPYNALLNDFEKGCTVSFLDDTFSGCSGPLKQLIDRIAGCPPINNQFLAQYFSKQDQWDFGMKIIGKLGFDFSAGRQDISEHPFTTSFNNRDVRITTRIDEHHFSGMLWSCIHETGHALYEQGLPESEYGLPLGEYASLGIHESQSRLWENCVGRSLAFWTHYYPELQESFPEQLGPVSIHEFYRGINKVHPSLIRTEADELTYHFHVIIRYNIEKLLIEGNLPTREIPECWNGLYKQYLDLDVPDDKRGCLQDIHWSHGSFGYFPTYSLGSFYAAQLFEKSILTNAEIEGGIKEGNTKPLLDFLRKSIYQYGRMYTSGELFAVIGKESLNINYFLKYVLTKYEDIYNL
ncbi:MAG TPA: carboxypeptidase M32 [Puia sp.]|nr:carboxypeptidase M32 [Puia sp.]